MPVQNHAAAGERRRILSRVRMAARRIRRFAGALVALGMLALLTACDNSAPGPQSETELVLGTTVSITIYDEVPSGAFEEAFARVSEIEARMSTSEEDYDSTELLEVNRSAGMSPVEVSDDTFHVVQTGLRYAEITNGLFDITIEPLVNLWGIGTEDEQIPSEQEVRELLPLVDYRNVELDAEANTIFLTQEGMGLDVGGIAKGYAADEVARILQEKGVEHALLDFGGNILTVGKKPEGSKWRIGIQSPGRGRGQYLGIATTGPQTIVTSGNYERFFMNDGTRYHHILDPRDGFPARPGLSSVTVLTQQSMAADALSTGLYVMGLEEGMRFAEDMEQIEAIFVTKDQGVYLSSGLQGVFDVTNESYSVEGAAPGQE
jgi:thiamine biosynthesis lipoprotein